MCDVVCLCANFGLRPLCSRLRPDVRDRQTFIIHSYPILLIITMTERIMYSERHAEYIKQTRKRTTILIMNVSTLVYTTYVQ